MGQFSRDKGARVEREIVDRHKAIGVHAARAPLPGSANGFFSSNVGVHVFGADAVPLVSEVRPGRTELVRFPIPQFLGVMTLGCRPPAPETILIIPDPPAYATLRPRHQGWQNRLILS
jgi:hypothetical protein